VTELDGLFHIDGADALTAMHVTPYAAESLLQGLLTRHPDLLAGGQMDPNSPRRWLLISQEHGVPDRDEATGDRWSLDHLFVDQDAIPTLVEVKRSSDTRIRREVVGQMMDYAANGVLYWPLDRLRETFSATQRDLLGLDPDEAVRDLTGDPDDDVETFFDRVFENLRAGHVRLVFVADMVPDELRRIVEFLNVQMSPAEVFAVEVKQYTAPGFTGRTIVPTVIGRTAASSLKQRTKAPIDAGEVRASTHPASRELFSRISEWAPENGAQLRETPAGTQLCRADGTVIAQLYYNANTLDIDLGTLRRRDPELGDQIWDQLQAVTTKRLTRTYPAIPTIDVVANWPLLGLLLRQLI
jgi:hypothetical protein